ncbi:MAG: hypothetical protein V4672_13205 [Verrucomicrobiota bacterium]
MLSRLLFAAVLGLAIGPCFAESPDEIHASYQKRAAAACEKIDAVLNKECTAIAADRAAQGDTGAAATIAEQMRRKIAGESVPTPHSAIASLFIMYDSAKLAVLRPVKEASLKEIDAELQRQGKDMTTVVALSRVREVIASTAKKPGEGDQEGKPQKLDVSKLELLFVQKTWLSAVGTKYFFAPDKTGYRLHGNDKTPLTWKISTGGVVEAQGFMSPGEPAVFFFKFQDEDHGIFGRQHIRFMRDPITSERVWVKPGA